MTDLLLDGAFAPFTMALALLLGLVGMEVLALLLGGSLLASGIVCMMPVSMLHSEASHQRAG